MAKAAWILTGALFGLALIAMASVGVFLLPVTLLIAAVLAFKRLKGGWLFFVAAGISFASAWLSLVIDPNAPDDSLLPVISGALVAGCAWLLYRRSDAQAQIDNH